MSVKCGSTASKVEPEMLELEHTNAKKISLLMFAEAKIMQADKYFAKLEKQLKDYIETEFIEFQKINAAKMEFWKKMIAISAGVATAVGIAAVLGMVLLRMFR